MDVEGYTMWVVGGSLLVAAPQVPPHHVREVLATLDQAQRCARGSMGARFQSPQRWFRACRRALADQGWNVAHSCQSVESSKQCGLISPLQPLLLWLGAVHPEHADLLDRCVAALDPAQPALAQLSRRGLQRSDSGSRLMVELGLILSGPTLSLCHVALDIDLPVGTDWLLTPFPGALLRGDISFQGAMFEPGPLLSGLPGGPHPGLPVSRTLH